MTRKDPLEKLQLRHDNALASFFDAADELEATAEELNLLATAANQRANAELSRAATARLHAERAIHRAGRIRELLG